MASRSLGTLTVDLVAKTGGFEAGMDKAARTADQKMRQIERRAKQFGTALGVALVAGVGIAANEIRKTIDAMDDLSKAAKTVGMDTEGFSRLAYAADLANVSQEELQSGLGRLVKAQAAAMDASSQQAQMFKALGIAITDAEGAMRPTRDVMLDFADRFAALKGRPEALAAGLEIFGRGFQTFVPLIEGGSQAIRDLESEADQLGVTLSTEAGDAAEAFNDNITRLKASVQGFWMEVASGMMPQLLEASERLAEVSKQGHLADAAITLLSGAVDFGVGAVEVYTRAIQRASIQLEGFVGIASGVRQVLVDGAFSGDELAAGMQKIATAAKNERDALVALDAAEKAAANNPFRRVRSQATSGSAASGDANVDALRRALGGGDKAGKKAGKSDAEREAEQLQRAYDSLMGSMKERIALFNTEGEAAKVAYDLEFGSLSALDEAQKANVLTLAQQYDQMVKVREEGEARAEMAKEETDRINDGLEAGKQLVQDLQFELELIRMTNAERATAIQLRGMEAEAVAEYGEEIAKLNQKIEQSLEAEAFWQDFQSSMSDAFYDFATGAKSAEDALGDFLDAIYESSIRAASEYFSESITNMFKGMGGSGSSGSGGGGWAELFGAFFGGGKAGGGWTAPNTMYEVNERGMEMASVNGRDYLLTGGSPVEITPNHMLGGGTPMTNNFNFAAPVSAKTQKQVAARISFEQRRAARFVGA